MQKDTIEEQIGDYLKLQEIKYEEVPINLIIEMKKQAEEKFSDDYATQLLAIENEIEKYDKYKKIKKNEFISYKNKHVPLNILNNLKDEIIFSVNHWDKDNSCDYSIHLQVLNEQIEAFLKLQEMDYNFPKNILHKMEAEDKYDYSKKLEIAKKYFMDSKIKIIV